MHVRTQARRLRDGGGGARECAELDYGLDYCWTMNSRTTIEGGAKAQLSAIA